MAKRRTSKKKSASVHLDAAALRKLATALESLADLAKAIELAVGDPRLLKKPRRGKKKGAKTRSRRARTKSR
jgi:hypothetical protein